MYFNERREWGSEVARLRVRMGLRGKAYLRWRGGIDVQEEPEVSLEL
jgi:hypothetical protein